jgi:hypothetical protein
VLEFQQSTIGQIIDSEREMVLTALQRYGKYYETALEGSLLMTRFLKSVDPDRWIFGSFVSLVKKHHTLALFSTVRLQNVQAMMNLRQTLEAGACAAFAIANPDHSHFVDADESGIIDPSQTLAKKRYNWLTENYPEGSAAIKEIKDRINMTTAHPNLISTHRTCRTDDAAGQLVAPFLTSRTSITLKQTYGLSRMSPTLCCGSSMASMTGVVSLNSRIILCLRSKPSG